MFCKTLRPLHRSSARPSSSQPSFSSDVLATRFGRACKREQCAYVVCVSVHVGKVAAVPGAVRIAIVEDTVQLRCAFSVTVTRGTAQSQHSALDRCCTDNTPHISTQRRKYWSFTFLHQPYGPHLKSWSSPPPNCSRQPFPPLPSSSTVGGEKTGTGGKKAREIEKWECEPVQSNQIGHGWCTSEGPPFHEMWPR